MTVPWLDLFGASSDAASLVLSFYSLILLIAVYGLGAALFRAEVGLLAALLCQLLPGLYRYRLEFLLDYPLTAAVTWVFWLLTLFKVQAEAKKLDTTQSWGLTIGLGLSLGLALLVKQTALFFVFLPLLWVVVTGAAQKRWRSLFQLIGALLLSVAIFGPWYRTNWLLMLTAGKRATLDSAIAEGDPALNTIEAWTYYAKILPYLLSWPLLLVPAVGILIYWGKTRDFQLKQFTSRLPWRWLGLFLFGGYLLSSLNINKDARYILPLLPVISLILAVGLLSWRGRYYRGIRWGTASLALLLATINLFPVGGTALAQVFSPHVEHRAYLGQPWPHGEVIATITANSPYLQTTLGVLPSTPEINQHNFSFYGAQANFQVFGRQVGVRDREVALDARSLHWFLTKNGDRGSVPAAQGKIEEIVEESPEFRLQDQWNLPDASQLKLYRRKLPTVEVQPLPQTLEKIHLEQVQIPVQAPPGQPIPVTYYWIGPWQALRSGLVILTWHKQIKNGEPLLNSVNQNRGNQDLTLENKDKSRWLHDRALAMGFLRAGLNQTPNGSFLRH
ncbi:MAG: phospholipid carrier-dependent glycosyltransferase [Chloroflexaceae bacterium]|nr:phospholipid carrier-dependent glycosyltransferase [Chloroflexaceae bacterium]